MRNFSARLFQMLICICIATLCLEERGNCAVADPAIDMNAILTVWRERAEEVRSAKFVWTEHRIHPKLDGKINTSETSGEGNAPEGPSHDVAFDVKHILMVAGDKMRYSWEGKVWDKTGNGVEDQSYIASFNGSTPKLFWPAGANSYPSGAILSGKKLPDVNQLQTLPFLLIYRALHPEMGLFDPKQFAPAAPQAMIRGEKCLLLKQQAGAMSYWIEMSRLFPMRYVTELNGKIGLQVDFKYNKDRKYGYIPSGWRSVVYRPDGSLLESSESKVIDYSINPSIPDEEFELSFPPNARVSDLRTPSELGNYTDYIERKNGEKRIITSEENRLATYEQLVNSETGSALA